MLAVSASVYASWRKRARQEGGTARRAAVPPTERVEAGLRFSKDSRLSFIETETAGYHGQMQSWKTKGKLIALPPSHKQPSEKGAREKGRGWGMRCGKGPLAFLLSTWHWQLTLTQCPRWAGDKAQEAETPKRRTPCVFLLFSVSFAVSVEWILNVTVLWHM